MENRKKLINTIYHPPSCERKYPFENFYKGDFHKSYFSLARHALKAGLISLNLQKNDKVLIPSFICRDVMAPFHELGIEILFYELDKELKMKVLPKDLPHANAIVAVHYFGLETDLAPFVEYCEIQNAYLIEDNAHGLFGRNTKNVLLGTIGDIGIISIRKTLPIQNGAILLQASRYKKVNQVLIHDYINLTFKIKNQLRPLVATFGIKFLLKITKLKRLLRKWKTGTEIPLSSDMDEMLIPFESNPVDIEKRISSVDIEAEIYRRRELFFYLNDFMKEMPIFPVRVSLTSYEVPYSYPFYCESNQIEKIINSLGDIGLEVVHWPSLPSCVLSNPTTPEFYQSLYLVKFLW